MLAFRPLFAAACCALAPALATAQGTGIGEFRAAAAAALGRNPAIIEFSGSGWDACLGQAWSVNEGWARWELTDYRRVVNYTDITSIQTALRRAGLDPGRIGGCGAQSDATATEQRTSVSTEAGFAEQLPVWLTPHGILRLAGEVGARIDPAEGGYELALSVPEGEITYRVAAVYGDDFLPVSVRTWIDDPVFGDMQVEAEFDHYRDFGGIRFPGSIAVRQGGLVALDLTIDSVAAVTGDSSVDDARGSGFRTARAADGGYSEIAAGIFVMAGAYQAVAVEFDSFSVVIDGMQNDARTAEIIRLTREAIPDKPIRYVVNTHAHFDHASGIRQFAAAGATILTHGSNVDFLRAALASPRTLNPGRIEPERVSATIIGVDGEFVIDDEMGQRLELHALEPSPHAADMLIGWLPAIRTVIEADILQPWINPIFAGSGDGPHPLLVYLNEELQRLGLDVAAFVPVHQPPEPPTMPRSALDAALGR